MIERYDVNENWAHTGLIKAGDFCFLSYCVGNIGGTMEEQINGAFDEMERRLALVGLTLENVVQMDCLFRDVWNIPMLRVIRCCILEWVKMYLRNSRRRDTPRTWVQSLQRDIIMIVRYPVPGLNHTSYS